MLFEGVVFRDDEPDQLCHTLLLLLPRRVGVALGLLARGLGLFARHLCLTFLLGLLLHLCEFGLALLFLRLALRIRFRLLLRALQRLLLFAADLARRAVSRDSGAGRHRRRS